MENIILLHSLSLIIVVITIIFTKKRMLAFLKEKKIVVKNYVGRMVPTGGGLMLFFSCLFGVLPYMLSGVTNVHYLYFTTIISLTFAGFIDDIIGDKSAKGLVGHAKTVLRGGFSTGAVKAFIGGIIGFLLALSIYSTFIVFLMDILVFSLCVNLMNLLDLQPGRTIKGFSLLLIVMVSFSGFASLWVVWPLVVGLCMYLKDELNEKTMLGDTGANLIGGVLGFYAVITLAQHVKILLGFFLVGMHLFTEFYSLSRWIDASPLLRYVDRIGRKSGR